MKRMLTAMVLVLLSQYLWADTGKKDSPPPGTAPVTVEKILQKYQEACGPALGEIKNEVSEGTFVRGVSGKGPIQIFSESPGKWRFNHIFAWGDRIIHACDGTQYWIQDTDSLYSMSPDQQLDMKLLFDYQSPLKLKKIFPDMKVDGTEKVNDKEATTITAKTADGISRELVFDNESGLLVRIGDISLDNYRDVGEVKRPFKIKFGISREDTLRQMTMEFTDIKHNQALNDTLFNQPHCELTMTDSPIYKNRIRAEVTIEALDACVGEYLYPRDTNLIVEVVRQGNHLMMGIKGLGGKMEIVPESELDYYINFLNREYHFVKDESGMVVAMEFGADRVRGKKIK